MPVGNIAKKRGKAKINLNVKMTVIQDLIPLGLKAVADELQNEVKRLAGDRHSRAGTTSRWGGQNGSAYLRDQKFPIRVPRVRDVGANKEVAQF